MINLSIQPGDVIQVDEQSYCYGLGSLILRVTEILGVRHDPDGPWLDLRGSALRTDGSDRGERQVLVKASALRRRMSDHPGVRRGAAPA